VGVEAPAGLIRLKNAGMMVICGGNVDRFGGDKSMLEDDKGEMTRRTSLLGWHGLAQGADPNLLDYTLSSSVCYQKLLHDGSWYSSDSNFFLTTPFAQQDIIYHWSSSQVKWTRYYRKSTTNERICKIPLAALVPTSI
jgi:hypothetical protein